MGSDCGGAAPCTPRRGWRWSGSGYIGLPTAVSLATGGLDVIGVDVNAGIVELVNRGETPFAEPDLSGRGQRRGRDGPADRAASEMPQAGAYIIAVPTPFDRRRTEPDLSAVLAAAEAIAPVLRGGEVIVLESTVPPGTTRRVSEPIGSLRPDLRLPHQPGRRRTCTVAHCPERVLPGRIMIEIATNDRVIGGLTPACAQRGRGALPDVLPRRAASSPTRPAPRWPSSPRTPTATSTSRSPTSCR